MKIETCEKESFVVIGKEGATTDGAALFRSYGMRRIPILEKSHIWQRKMKMGTSAEYGAQCLTFPVPSSPGRAFRKDFTLQG